MDSKELNQESMVKKVEPMDSRGTLPPVIGDEVILASELANQVQLYALQTKSQPRSEQELLQWQEELSSRFGLTFEIRGHKHPHWTAPSNSPATFGHFGGSGSFLWVDPEAGLAAVSIADEDFGDWSLDAWPAVSQRILETYSRRQ